MPSIALHCIAWQYIDIVYDVNSKKDDVQDEHQFARMMFARMMFARMMFARLMFTRMMQKDDIQGWCSQFTWMWCNGAMDWHNLQLDNYVTVWVILCFGMHYIYFLQLLHLSKKGRTANKHVFHFIIFVCNMKCHSNQNRFHLYSKSKPISFV